MTNKILLENIHYLHEYIKNEGITVDDVLHFDAGRLLIENPDAYYEALADLSVEVISKYLYTAGQPDPDLLIRTSGEQRLGGFLLWQSTHSEFYFCEAYWPDFRRVDFLRALRSYAQRHRRFGK